MYYIQALGPLIFLVRLRERESIFFPHPSAGVLLAHMGLFSEALQHLQNFLDDADMQATEENESDGSDGNDGDLSSPLRYGKIIW